MSKQNHNRAYIRELVDTQNLALILATIDFGVAFALTVFTISNLTLIQSDHFFNWLDQMFASGVTVANILGSLIALITSTVGIKVWSSLFPKKCAIKLHLILLLVTVIVLCVCFGSCFFNLVNKSKYFPNDPYQKDRYLDEMNKHWEKGKQLTRFSDLSTTTTDEKKFNKNYEIQLTALIFEWLITIGWFSHVIIDIILAGMICNKYEELTSLRPVEEVSGITPRVTTQSQRPAVQQTVEENGHSDQVQASISLSPSSR